MYMGTGTVTAAAHKTDDLTFAHRLSRRHGDTAHVTVGTFVTVAVINLHVTAVTTVPAGHFHGAHGTGINGSAKVCGNIHAWMPIVTALDGTGTAAVCGTYHAAFRGPQIRKRGPFIVAAFQSGKQFIHISFLLVNLVGQIFILRLDHGDHAGICRTRTALAHVVGIRGFSFAVRGLIQVSGKFFVLAVADHSPAQLSLQSMDLAHVAEHLLVVIQQSLNLGILFRLVRLIFGIGRTLAPVPVIIVAKITGAACQSKHEHGA